MTIVRCSHHGCMRLYVAPNAKHAGPCHECAEKLNEQIKLQLQLNPNYFILQDKKDDSKNS